MRWVTRSSATSAERATSLPTGRYSASRLAASRHGLSLAIHESSDKRANKDSTDYKEEDTKKEISVRSGVHKSPLLLTERNVPIWRAHLGDADAVARLGQSEPRRFGHQWGEERAHRQGAVRARFGGEDVSQGVGDRFDLGNGGHRGDLL